MSKFLAKDCGMTKYDGTERNVTDTNNVGCDSSTRGLQISETKLRRFRRNSFFLSAESSTYLQKQVTEIYNIEKGGSIPYTLDKSEILNFLCFILKYVFVLFFKVSKVLVIMLFKVLVIKLDIKKCWEQFNLKYLYSII